MSRATERAITDAVIVLAKKKGLDDPRDAEDFRTFNAYFNWIKEYIEEDDDFQDLLLRLAVSASYPGIYDVIDLERLKERQRKLYKKEGLI